MFPLSFPFPWVRQSPNQRAFRCGSVGARSMIFSSARAIFLASIVLLALGGCNGSALPPLVASGSGILIINTDFNSGSYSYYPSSGGVPIQRDLAVIHSDAVAAIAGSRLAVVNRFGQDNILFLTRTLQPGAQFSVGSGSNPYDIAEVDPSRILVSRYGSSRLLVMNAENGDHLAEIDLSDFADSDEIPEMAYMVSLANPRRILVALQRLSNFAPSDFSSYAIINPLTLTVEAVRQFSLKNPVTRWVSDGTHLYIGLVGSFGSPDGGIVRINGQSLIEDSILLTEAEIQQDIGPFIYAGGRFYIITSDLTCGQPPWTPCTTSLYQYAPPNPPRLLKTSPGFHFSSVAILPGTPFIALADRNPEAPGIWFYDPRTDTFTTSSPISVSNLPPFDMLAVF